MIATSHVLISGAVGVAVGSVTKNPAAALVAGLATHLLCDMLPHLDSPPNIKFNKDGEAVWDRGLYIFAITDSLIALIAVLLIWYFKFKFFYFSPFAWGAFGGYLPDLIDNFPLWRDAVHQTPVFKQFHEFHLWIHDNWRRYYPMPQYWVLGILTQIVTVVPSLWFLLK